MRFITLIRSVDIKRHFISAIAILLAMLLSGVALSVLPPGWDWQHYIPHSLSTWRDPYQSGYVYPPWTLLFLVHGLLPLQWGAAVNRLITIVVILLVLRRNQADWKAFLLVLTSFPFIFLLFTNHIDWIPLAAFLLPPQLGLILLACKPQALGGAALIWWKQSQLSLKMLLPTLVLAAVSFVVWGNWVSGMRPISGIWNIAPWPFAIPLGLAMLYRAYQSNDEVLAAAATPFLVPYMAWYSLTGLMVLLATKHPKEAFYLWSIFWILIVLAYRYLVVL